MSLVSVIGQQFTANREDKTQWITLTNLPVMLIATKNRMPDKRRTVCDAI